MSVHVDWATLEKLAKSRAVADALTDVAETVAENARSAAIFVEGIPGDIELPVKVESYTTDRARSSVMIAHPAGLAVQAKHGLLTKAAAEAGLEVAGE